MKTSVTIVVDRVCSQLTDMSYVEERKSSGRKRGTAGGGQGVYSGLCTQTAAAAAALTLWEWPIIQIWVFWVFFLFFWTASRSARDGSHSSVSRRLLLLVFGSRPSDQTEGTFVGIGDATNMAVRSQGFSGSVEWTFDLFDFESDLQIYWPVCLK